MTSSDFYDGQFLSFFFTGVSEVASKGSTSTETQAATLKEFYLQLVSVLGEIKKHHCTLISTHLMDKESKTNLSLQQNDSVEYLQVKI